MGSLSTTYNDDYSSTANMSPQRIASVLFMRIYEYYVQQMSQPAAMNINVDGLTASIIVSCPEKSKRDAIWNLYVQERDKPEGGNVRDASAKAIGEWFAYMMDALGLTEKSGGGF